MMKIIHLSDPHIYIDKIHGIDPVSKFKKALSHIKNISEIFRAINLSLSDKGVLVLEDPSLLECMKNLAYDQFYCEHIYIFSTLSLKIFRFEDFHNSNGSTAKTTKYDVQELNAEKHTKKAG